MKPGEPGKAGSSEPAQVQIDRRPADWEALALPCRPLKVALIAAPWARTYSPSLQCGLLKAEARRYGHEVDVLYLSLELSAFIGEKTYNAVQDASQARQDFFGEWLFGTAAYEKAPDARAYLENRTELLEALGEHGISVAGLTHLRDEVLPEWVRSHAEKIAASGYDVVGFSSTFEQNVASFALARHVKQISPQTAIVFGGANFDGEMGPEYLRVMPFIDYAVIGEGDLVFPALLARLAAGTSPIGLPGVWGRSGDRVTGAGTAPPVQDMNVVPVPDFDDYFAALSRLGRREILGDHPAHLVYESSRGCWWGEKHHCTFCGLNRLSMGYRAKSPERALDDLTCLAGKYQVTTIDAVDNILDMNYLGTFCKRLREAPWDPNLFFEVKANLTRSHLKLLSESGVRRIQPGLESLNSHVLALMRKGSSMSINVTLLKWALYYGITFYWAIITGFPGEHDQDYEEQIDLIPSLYHLPPPERAAPLWLERFSPYYTEDFPIHDVRPCSAYEFVYPVPGLDLNKVAYFFDYKAADIASADVLERLQRAVEQWRRLWNSDEPPTLSYIRGPGWITMRDTRWDEPRQATLAGWRASVYQYCGDKAMGVSRIRAHLDESYKPGPSDEVLAKFLQACISSRIMLCEKERYLSLALPQPERTAALDRVTHADE
jgi:ribosomal peptide maturation radical SAM protein 1